MFCCLTRNPNRNRKANHKRHQSENVAVNVFPRNKSSMIFNDYDGREQQKDRESQKVKDFSSYGSKSSLYNIFDEVIEESIISEVDHETSLHERLFKIVQTQLQTKSNISNHMQKVVQSSLEGMKKQTSQTLIQDQSSFAILQFYSKSISQMFTKALVQKDYQRCLYIFERMTKQQKNQLNQQSHSPLHVAVLHYIYYEQNLEFLKSIIYHQDINEFILPLYEAISYKNFTIITHLLKASQKNKSRLFKQQLHSFSLYLQNIPDFHISIQVKVDSFFPFIDKIAPHDTIHIYKKGNRLRIDYTLVGYSYLKCKRRRMSCILLDDTIYAVNHDQKTYTNILSPLTKQEIVLIIGDLLSQTKSKKNINIKNVFLELEKDFFEQTIETYIANCHASKYSLTASYRNTKQRNLTHKKMQQLSYLTDWETYSQHIHPKVRKNFQQKQIKLDLWLTNEYKLKLSQILKILSIFSVANDSIELIHSFLSNPKIQSILTYFPLKIQIPASFSLFLDIQFSSVEDVQESINFNFSEEYAYKERHIYQKTLERKEKRMILSKFYL